MERNFFQTHYQSSMVGVSVKIRCLEETYPVFETPKTKNKNRNRFATLLSFNFHFNFYANEMEFLKWKESLAFSCPNIKHKLTYLLQISFFLLHRSNWINLQICIFMQKRKAWNSSQFWVQVVFWQKSWLLFQFFLRDGILYNLQ
jgi:hypothetical protein